MLFSISHHASLPCLQVLEWDTDLTGKSGPFTDWENNMSNIRALHVYGLENVCKIIFVDILCSFCDIFISRMFMNRNNCKFQFV